MKKRYVYIGVVLFFSIGIILSLYIGYLNAHNTHATSSFSLFTPNGVLVDIKNLILKQFAHPLALLLTQIIVIMITTKFFGFLTKKILMPIVIGEIIAGIVLGPSFFGAISPVYSKMLFPVDSLINLNFISQIGLIFFMFVVGMELDWQNLKNQTKASVIISHSSILFPFFLGVTLALFLYDNFAPKNTNFIPFALFIGIAMSITAFPVLARIVKEKNLANTKYGAMALTCAAADDATAWYILAVIIAISSSTSLIASILSFGLIVIYMIIMIYIVKPFLAKLGNVYKKSETLDMNGTSIVLIILLISSLTTEVIGIHALFGAFIAGAIMPSSQDSRLRELLSPKLEYVSILVLLPIFFALTGLRTQIGLIETTYQWLICLSIITIAIIGKFFGASISAKFVGFSWKESFNIGTLMNTRGLMELIVLNIGFELGIISAELFTMFVIMALVTTIMTGPALYIIEKYKFN